MKNAHDLVRHAMLGLLLSVGLGVATAASDSTSQAQDATKAQGQRRQKLIEQCMVNRGSKEDCAKQVDTELAAEGINRQHSQGEGKRGGHR